MGVLLWVHDHFWWLVAGLVPCVAAICVGLWLGRYQPTHAGGPVPERLWPLVGDPRYGSMQLDADRPLTAYELGIPVGPDVAWREMVALGEEIGDAPPWPDQVIYPGTAGIIHQLPAPPLDWREVAHEEDWRDQTAHDLAPAVLDSGPGGPSLAPGPDLATLDGLLDGLPIFGVPEVRGHWVSGPPEPEPEPEPERTVAGRLVETRDEWLRRLTRDAAPGWTYAGELVAA